MVFPQLLRFSPSCAWWSESFSSPAGVVTSKTPTPALSPASAPGPGPAQDRRNIDLEGLEPFFPLPHLTLLPFW